MNRIGTGWDIHALEEGHDLILGGVRIESSRGCVGHSDGDALIHAVIDSVLGACGLGDIGMLFPDTDPRYRGIDSSILLKTVMEMVREDGFRIVNVDTTVILQSPKLGPYRQAICEKMTALLGLKEGFFNLKAKTAEKMLAEAGEGRAVICQSICLVESV
jgi:2-C-methyl-D-erythritol 2,4-cyclodiphosphate synthase